ncbi:MAG: hypothetical protein Q4E74_09030 [Ruminococcus sp.]|nr:hypothetical protein [Ruminococcus sp.]
MKFDLGKNITQLNSVWNKMTNDYSKHNSANPVCIIKGLSGIGKTSLAIEYINGHTNGMYFSFFGADNDTALKLFCERFSLWTDLSSANSWSKIFEMLTPYLKQHKTVIALDDLEYFKNKNEVLSSVENCISELHEVKNLFLILQRQNKNIYSGTCYEYKMPCRSIAEIKSTYLSLSNKDVIRIYACTGGILSLLDLYDENQSFEDNFKSFLCCSSSFYKLMPDMMNSVFRTPESYSRILYSIANGKNRISEIAADVSFENNKCDKYVKALINAGSVAAKEIDKNRSEYYIANSYIEFWYRYFYTNRNALLMNDEYLFIRILDNLNTSFAINCYREACLRKISSTFYELNYSLIKREGKPYTVRFKNGSGVHFDYVIRVRGQWTFIKISTDFDWRCTKDELQKLLAAAKKLEPMLCNIRMIIFSMNRFSDYCVHEASLMSGLKLVTLEQLRY